MTALLPYPLTAADVPRAVERVALWVSMRRQVMEKQFSVDWLATELRKGLRAGRLTLTIKALEAAEKHDDEIADVALREVYAELIGGAIAERGPGHLQILAFGQRAVLRAPHQRGRGHRWHDHWMRNITICVWIELACREFGVRASRNRAARRANREPSGCSLVVAALARNEIYLDEGTVQQNLWFGLAGELARGIVPAYLKKLELAEGATA
jgi:hypothetical protein